jgi:hypothetical protein
VYNQELEDFIRENPQLGYYLESGERKDALERFKSKNIVPGLNRIHGFLSGQNLVCIGKEFNYIQDRNDKNKFTCYSAVRLSDSTASNILVCTGSEFLYDCMELYRPYDFGFNLEFDTQKYTSGGYSKSVTVTKHKIVTFCEHKY